MSWESRIDERVQETLRKGILEFWRQLGIDPLDERIVKIDPALIKISRKKRDSINAAIIEKYPELLDQWHRNAWTMVRLIYTPKTDQNQELDVIILKGGIEYAEDTDANMDDN